MPPSISLGRPVSNGMVVRHAPSHPAVIPDFVQLGAKIKRRRSLECSQRLGSDTFRCNLPPRTPLMTIS